MAQRQGGVTRVVYVVESPLTPRDRDRFGMPVLQEAGLAVEAWEVDAVYLPRADRPGLERAEDVPILRFVREGELTRAVADLPGDCLVISLSGPYQGQLATHRPLLKALGRSRCLFGAINSGHRPPSAHEEQPAARTSGMARRATAALARMVAPGRPGVLARRQAVARATRRPSSVRPLDYLWAGTQTYPIDPALIGPATVVRYIHTIDYDAVIALAGGEQPVDIEALYIDSMGPLHPDFDVSSVPVLVEPGRWFDEVNRALDAYEIHTGTRVTVAAHPRASRADVARWYRGRAVTELSTPRAIARSRIVLATSGSTSLGLAAALKVPVLVVRTTGIHRIHQPDLEAYREALHLPMIDATGDLTRWPVVEVDVTRYESFVAQYMKRPGTRMVPFWQQVADDILSIGRPGSEVQT